MIQKTHNKLIRDKIPDLLDKKGITYDTRILSENEYKDELYKKLIEEVKELQESDGDIYEFADILEVFYALLDLYNIEKSSLENKRELKANLNGKFNKHLYLSETIERNI